MIAIAIFVWQRFLGKIKDKTTFARSDEDAVHSQGKYFPKKLIIQKEEYIDKNESLWMLSQKEVEATIGSTERR